MSLDPFSRISLYNAKLEAAASGERGIKFVLTLEGQTLVLTGGELPVTQDLTPDFPFGSGRQASNAAEDAGRNSPNSFFHPSRPSRSWLPDPG